MRRLLLVAAPVCLIVLILTKPGVAQVLLPDFTIDASTIVSVNIVLQDGQRATVPIRISFAVHNSAAGGVISLDASAEQQPGMSITVEKSGHIDASIYAYLRPDISIPTPMPIAITPTAAPPVFTPTPVSTLPPHASSEEAAFAAQVIPIIDGYSEAFANLSDLLTATGNAPALMYDETWKIETAAAIAIIRNLNDRTLALNAPPRFVAGWNEVRAAAGLYNQSMGALVSGIDNSDVGQLATAQQYLLDGNAAIQRATALLTAE